MDSLCLLSNTAAKSSIPLIVFRHDATTIEVQAGKASEITTKLAMKEGFEMNLMKKSGVITLYSPILIGVSGLAESSSTLFVGLLALLLALPTTYIIWKLSNRKSNQSPHDIEIIKSHFFNSMNIQLSLYPLLLADIYWWTPFFDSLDKTPHPVFLVVIPLTFLLCYLYISFVGIRSTIAVFRSRTYSPRFVIHFLK